MVGGDDLDFNLDMDDIIDDIKKSETNQTEVDKIIEKTEIESNNEIQSELSDDDEEEVIVKELTTRENRILNNDIKQAEDIIKFKEQEYNTSKENNNYDDVEP